MPYLYLILSVFCMSAGSICGGYYSRKNKDKRSPTPIYNLLMISTVFLGWTILFVTDFSFDVKVLCYAIPMGICYSTCVFSNISAIKCGPVSLSALFLQLSLIGVTVWGFIFWNAQVTVWSVVGLVLAVGSIVLCLYEKKDGEEKTEENKISLKWLIFALLSFFANAATSILQRTQQIRFNGEHANTLMFFAMGIGMIAFSVMYVFSDKTDSKVLIKKSGWLPVVYGVANVGLNLFLILLATSSISPSLIYPVVGVGGLAINSVASVVLFKERLHWWQWFGIAVGALAVVLLSV